jgi:hypothetical protein
MRSFIASTLSPGLVLMAYHLCAPSAQLTQMWMMPLGEIV